MATRAYWLMGRLYPTADVGLFCICSDLLWCARQKRGWNPKMRLVHIETKYKMVSGDYTILFLPIVDNTKTVYKPMKDSCLLTAEVKRVQNIPNWFPKIISEAHYFYLMAGKKRHWPFSRNQRLKLPLILLRVKGQSVHDLVFLLWWNEVLNDEVPARTQHI